MNPERYDLVVIGSGPAGEKGAAQAAYFGKRVLVIEKAPHLGGAGINTGTVPSKTLRESALYYSGLRQRDLYGINYSLREGLKVSDFLYRKERVVETGWQLIETTIVRHRIQLLRGAASFEDPHTLRVEGEGTTTRVSGDVILIATGSAPWHPPGIPFDDPRVLDSDSILHMDRIPRSLVVVGGGVIGCEYASLMSALGVRTIVVDAHDRLLTFLDGEISERLAHQWIRYAMQVLHGQQMERLLVPPDPEAPLRLVLKSGMELEAEKVLIALGRRAATEDLALERAGLQADGSGRIQVDAQYRTAVPHIYAAGDVLGFPSLASVSMEQGRVAMCHAFDLRYKEEVSPVYPYGIYTIPEVSSIGETEESAREKKIPYVVGRGFYDKNPRGIIIGDLYGIVKLLFHRETRKLIGVHCLGESATEIVHTGAAVLHAGGGIQDFIDMVFNVPTLTDLYKYAAYDALGALDQGVVDGRLAPEVDDTDI